MTEMGVKYLTYKENQRSNLAKEAENYRSNVANETETHRANVARETETNRANLVKEAETYRSNLAKEMETNRSNLAREAETNRANLAQEDLKNRELNIKSEANEQDYAIGILKNMGVGKSAAAMVLAENSEIGSDIIEAYQAAANDTKETVTDSKFFGTLKRMKPKVWDILVESIPVVGDWHRAARFAEATNPGYIGAGRSF